MQRIPFIKISIITGLAVAGVIALYEVSEQLLIYRYFKFDYYIAAIAIIALAAGIVIANRYNKTKTSISPNEDGIVKLTARESRILDQIYAGRTNKEIAALNYIELSTVKTHINNIYAKMGVKNRKEVIRLYQLHLETQKSTLSPPAIV